MSTRILKFTAKLFAIMAFLFLTFVPQIGASALTWDDVSNLLRPSTQNSYCNVYNTSTYSYNTSNGINNYNISGKIYNPTGKLLYFKLETNDGYMEQRVRYIVQNPSNYTYSSCDNFRDYNGVTFAFNFDNQGLSTGNYRYTVSFDKNFNTEILSDNISIDSPYYYNQHNYYNNFPFYPTVDNYYNNTLPLTVDNYYYGNLNDTTLANYLRDLKAEYANGIMVLDYKCGNLQDLSLITRLGGQNICSTYYSDTKMNYVMNKYAQQLGYTLGDDNFMYEIRNNRGIIYEGNNQYWVIDFNKLATNMGH
jgi:hypothetical protein